MQLELNKHSGEDKQWHTFHAVSKVVADNLRCIECNRLATRNCLQCKDCYCERCFNRVHRKGRRKDHKYQNFAPGCIVCIECEKAPAEVTCDVCLDALCHDCAITTHMKGNKKHHTMTSLVQMLEEGQSYCEQCGCRPLDYECEYCELRLCQTCVHREHEVCIFAKGLFSTCRKYVLSLQPRKSEKSS